MLTLFDVENTKIGLLENLKDFVILEKLKNGSSTISFSLYRNDPYCKQIKEECYIETLDNRYIVKIINDQQTVIRYTCELDLESLTSKIWSEGFSNVRANVVETVKLAIAGTGWTVIDGGVNEKKRTINLKAMDSYEIIKNCLTKWDVEVKFDAKKRMITLADKIGSDKGVYFSDEFNLTTIHVESDSRSFATRLYVRGKDGLTFASINGGKDYIEDYSYTSKLVSKIWIDERYENVQQLLEDARLKLNDFCKPKSTYELEVVDLASLSNEYSFLEYGIGDSVTLLSAGKEIREVHRIVEIAKYPLEPERNTATLSNGLLTFEESQERNDAMAENIDSVLNEDGTLNGSKVDGITTEQIVDFEAKVVSVVDLSVVNAKIENLEASKASIEQLSAVQADIGDLRANTATIDQLKVTEARISVLEVNDVKVNGLLEASSAKINILEATSAEIKHLLAGNLSSENIQTGGITSDKLTIANGFIKDAMIDSLNANKIKVGQINTALVQVASSSGNLIINDNTIQIRDANRVRVQIGKDASNDYSMSVWDSSGKLMFDARGLKADAIKDSIIRNDMISTNANIDGSKLNISSVVSEINEGSTTLKASKVQFDGIAQTLEVAFNLLKTQADGTKSQTESNTTAINVAQGKINTLIQDTTITKDGQTVKLKDEYSKLEQTVGSLSSTIGKQQTTLDDHTGKMTAFNSEMVSLKQNLNGLSASVSTAETTIQSHTQQLAQKADLETVNEKIDAIPFVGRNLFLNSDFSSQESWAGLPTISKDGTINYIRSSSTFITSQKVDVIEGEEYVVSALVRAVTTTPTNFSIKFNVGNYNSTNIDITSTDWVRVSVTITAKSTIKEQIYLCNRGNAGIDIAFVKLEKGTKDTDWSLAPEDIQASIDAKANSSDVYVKTEVYTKAQTDSAIKLAKDEINLGVSSTYETKTNVETQINGVKSSVTNLESRVSKAEQKITDSAIIQTVSQTINQAKTEAIQSANSNTANQLKNYSTTLQMNSAIQQKADSITSDVFKIETSLAVDNLLSNGNFTNELNNWQYRDHGSSVNYTLTANTDWTMTGKTALLITQSNHPQGYDSGFTQEIDVKPNTDYTFTGYIASHRAEGMAVVKDDAGNWLVFDKTDADYDQYTGGPEVSRWKKIRLVYWSGNRTKLQLHLAMGKSNNNGHVWFHDFMVTEGNTDLCWKPSQKETRTQIAQLDNRISSTVTSVETIDGKVNKAQSQIDQHAHQIATKVNANDFSSLIQQNGHSIMWAINSSRGSNGIGLDSGGLYGYNNNITTLRLTEGKFHAYNSWNGNHMGYFGTNGDDLRACLYDTNTFSVYSNDTALLFRARYERDANYGNATLDMCGGINFIHKPGQDVGINQLLLGNDDRSDRYGFHNMSIRCWNSFGFQDNYGYTNMFFDSRRGRVIMKGALYQNTQTPPATFSMNFDGEDEIYSSGYERSQAIDSVMNLKTGVYVDNDGECCSAIYGGYSELITTEYQDEYGKITTHLNHEALNASLVVTCQEQQKLIKALQKELNEIKEYLNVA